MYNWGPSSSFKLWLDQTLRFGETILYTASGPKGTLTQKRATFILTAGAIYTPGSEGAALNYLEPWLRTYFSYLGIQSMQFLLADGAINVLQGKTTREAFLAPPTSKPSSPSSPVVFRTTPYLSFRPTNGSGETSAFRECLHYQRSQMGQSGLHWIPPCRK